MVTQTLIRLASLAEVCRMDESLAYTACPSAILRFLAGSYEWQAIGERMEAKNALRSLGEKRLPGQK